MGTQLSDTAERRLNDTLHKALENPKSRVYNNTFQGFLADQMDTQKEAVDNKPTVEGKATRVLGAYGWGIERNHLRAQHNILTDDMRVPSWPVDRKHLKELDAHLRTKFCREDYDKAMNADKKLGIEPNFYNGLDMQASRA